MITWFEKGSTRERRENGQLSDKHWHTDTNWPAKQFEDDLVWSFQNDLHRLTDNTCTDFITLTTNAGDEQ